MEQSRRLLELGLKKEAADCCYYYYDGEYLIAFAEDAKYPSDIPAWSLHRLIKLAYGNWKEDIVPIYLGDSYDMLIGRIEFQVKQGKFNKEYLV
jgi:hypothetical protein